MKKARSRGGDSRLSRRALVGAAASMAPFLSAQAQQRAAPAAGRGPGRGNNIWAVPQGGTGPINVLFITRYHPFDTDALFSVIDANMGKEITWTHVEHPAATAFFDPKLAAQFDVFMFYDAFTGRGQKRNPDGTVANEYLAPSPEVQANFKQLL